MYCRFAFLGLLVLLACVPIDDALAGHGSGSQSRSAHSSPRDAISARHHARGPDGGNGTYRSQRRQAKSEWRQALRAGNAQFRTVTR